MGLLQSVGFFIQHVSVVKEPCKNKSLLHNKPRNVGSLLNAASPCVFSVDARQCSCSYLHAPVPVKKLLSSWYMNEMMYEWYVNATWMRVCYLSVCCLNAMNVLQVKWCWSDMWMCVMRMRRVLFEWDTRERERGREHVWCVSDVWCVNEMSDVWMR